MITETNVIHRLEQFKRRSWSEEELTEWYGLDFKDHDTIRILVQAKWFAGTESTPSSLGSGPFDHRHLEVFFQRRELVPINLAAAELAMSREDFDKVLEMVEKSDDFLTVVKPRASKSLIHRNFLRDIHKGFPALRSMYFGSQPSYIKQLHDQIGKTGINVKTRECPTSRYMGDNPVLPGNQVDCLTNEPIGIRYSVFLETSKPLELAPDVCSWLTFARFEKRLKDHIISLPPRLKKNTIKYLHEVDE